MRVLKKLTSQEINNFKELYLSGKKNKEIAVIFNISIPTVKRMAKKLSLPKKYSKEYPIRFKNMAETFKLYSLGIGTYKIAKKLCISEESARRYLQRQGVQLRHTSGLTRDKIEEQNKIISKMYTNGTPIRDICSTVGLGIHGVMNRLRLMRIPRNRNVHQHVGDRYDGLIRNDFLNGKSVKEIKNKFQKYNGNGNFVVYRIKYIFKDTHFRLKYFSRLTKRWKVINKTYPTVLELRNAKMRVKKHTRAREFKVIPIPIVRFKNLNIKNETTRFN